MKKTKIAINGFGRIGRLALRIATERPNLEVVAINDPFITADYAAYMLKYDTTQGKFNADVSFEEDKLIVNGNKIYFYSQKNIEDINWKESGAEIVIEATGKFTSQEDAKKHIESGAKKAIITAASKDCPMFIVGVNEEKYDNSIDVLCASSCTTNCLAPLAKVVNDNFGIVEGLMTTVHSVTQTQQLLDGSSKKDWRGGRAATGNIIPSSTGAAKAVGKVIPALNGKLTGMSLRVPTLDVSIVDLTCKLQKETTYDEIIAALEKASNNELKGIMAITKEPLVSSDFIGDKHPCIVDASAGIMLNPTFVKLMAWYDNEYGYTNNMINLVSLVASKLK
ncbi:MAG: type I glyceraldehyde-3-phosphate dehydrogenase [Clostridia bacterium]|nr:type I glyceraldehyde-3-phosphate dehydrogenase [Clostridia bacterium]